MTFLFPSISYVASFLVPLQLCVAWPGHVCLHPYLHCTSVCLCVEHARIWQNHLPSCVDRLNVIGTPKVGGGTPNVGIETIIIISDNA